MKRTLQEHLDWLKSRLNALSTLLMATADRQEANKIESEIRMVRMAIGHYETALSIEQSLATRITDSDSTQDDRPN